MVATAVQDVVSNFGDVALVADSPRAFVQAALQAAAAPPVERIQQGARLAAQNTWDQIEGALERHLQTELARKARPQTAQVEAFTY